tara:strand:+ start:645 stop:1568 length:924 start_codon:yes stop_codon:yes gene_type:complete
MFQFIAAAANTITTAISSDIEDPDEVTTASSLYPPPNLTAKLTKVSPLKEDYHEYIIEVQFGHRQWTVKRRYNQFLVLHNTHQFTICTFDNTHQCQNTEIPEMPPKKMCGHREEPFVHSRKEHLANYLQQIMSNPTLRRGLPLREFLSDADPERIARLRNEYLPLLQAGARFKKIGTVFTRDIRMKLTTDGCALEYCDAHKGDDVKMLRIHTITNVSPTNDGLIITAERECELDTSMNSKSRFVRTAWINALMELMELMHLVRPDDSDKRETDRNRRAAALRDSTNNRQKAERREKRRSIANKYSRN